MTQKHQTILVVDDESMILAVTSKMLERAGFEILTATRGSDAVEICQRQEQPIDLLLIDIRMPCMNAVTLARCIADHKPGVPIVFMTGYSDESELKTLLTSQPNMDGHSVISKPFRAVKLVEQIEEMIARSIVQKAAGAS